jgi:[protein-PII] uridylyltransferase
LPDLFARICGYFDGAGFSIQDAKVHTTRAGYALDTFQVLWPAREPTGSDDEDDAYRDLIELVRRRRRRRWRRAARCPSRCAAGCRAACARSRSRRACRFSPTSARSAGCSRVSTSDRTGLLYAIARVLARHRINLHLAKISTLGERVEDTFLVDGPPCSMSARSCSIETELLDAVAPV